MSKVAPAQLKSLKSEYTKLACIVFIVMFFCSIGLCLIVYRQCQQKNQKIAEYASIEIQKIIEDILHDITHIMKYVGTEISRESPDNIAKIAEHLSHAREINGFSNNWTVLDWVDKTNRKVASSRWGIINPPKEVVDRQYLINSPKNTWKLSLCKPAWGVPSGVWIIPVGMGITNSNEQFLGIVTTGIDINAVTRKIRQSLNVIGINFIVFDESQNIVFQSQNNKTFRGNHLAQKLFKHFERHKSHQSRNQTHFSISKTLFYDYCKSESFPFYIFTGIDKQLVFQDLYISLLPILVQLFGFGFLTIAVLAFFWKKQIRPIVQLSKLAQQIKSGITSFEIPKSTTVEMHQIMSVIEQERSMCEETERIKNLLSDTNIQIQKSYEELNAKNNLLLNLQEEWSAFIQLIKNSDHEKDKFLRCLNHELEESMNEIINILYILLTTHNSFDIPITSETAFALLNKMQAELHNLKRLSSKNLKPSKIDIEQSIENCISIHSKAAFIRNIKIHFKTELLVPEFYLDKTRWQQIVVGILSRALQFTPDQGQIQISVSSNEDFLILLIQDEGLGLTENDIQRLENLFLSESLKFYDLTSSSLSTIEELIKLHGGSMKVESKWKEGTTVMISIPSINKERLNENQNNNEFEIANLFDR